MNIEKWIEEQTTKYKLALKDYQKKLEYAIAHENPEGVERAVSAVVKAQWYIDEILPVVRKYLPKKTAKKN